MTNEKPWPQGPEIVHYVDEAGNVESASAQYPSWMLDARYFTEDVDELIEEFLNL